MFTFVYLPDPTYTTLRYLHYVFSEYYICKT